MVLSEGGCASRSLDMFVIGELFSPDCSIKKIYEAGRHRRPLVRIANFNFLQQFNLEKFLVHTRQRNDIRTSIEQEIAS